MPPVPPTLVATYGSSIISTSPINTAVACEVGDVIVITAATSDSLRTLTAPTGMPVTWTLRQQYVAANYANGYIWTGTATATGSYTVSIAASGGNAGAQEVFYRVYRYKGSGGIGNSGAARGSGAPSYAFTPSRENSAIPWLNVDWNVVSGASRAYRAVANQRELGYALTAAATYYSMVIDDGDLPAAKTIGLTAPTGQVWTIVAVEVLGDTVAPGAPPSVAATALSSTSAQVAWGAATDNVSAASALTYNVYRGATLVGTTAAGALSFTDTGLSPGTGYSYTVRAVDASGNEGAASAAAPVTTPWEDLRLGAGTVKLRIGTDPVSRVYLGATQVWP